MSLLQLSCEQSYDCDLSKKTYLITGAANGIGRSLAKKLAQLNATIILLDKDSKQLDLVYDEINLSAGESIIVHQDLTLLTQGHCDSLFKQIKGSFARLDGIIHCAVESGNLAPIEYYSEDDWSNVIRANLHSPYLLTRTLLPYLTQGSVDKNTDKISHSKVIFSIAEQAIKSNAFWGAFAVAQQGLKALVETWSAETENSNIQFSMLDPGKVQTGFLTKLYPGLNPSRYPDAQTIAHAYLFILTQISTNLHGKILQVNDFELDVL